MDGVDVSDTVGVYPRETLMQENELEYAKCVGHLAQIVNKDYF